VIHSYRHRNLGAKGDPRFETVERQLATRPPITVPAIVLYGGDDGLMRPSPDDRNDRAGFTKLIASRIVAGAGHFLPRENPQAVASAILELLEGS
jgi:pimeloyl-ACP methyl ester carboxylesterase